MTEQGAASRTAGLAIAGLQLLMTLGWTLYVIYLPQLAASVGIPASTVIFLLMLDQAVFTVTDFAMGVAADRIAPVVGRLGRIVALVTALSCAAFLLLPFLAAGHAAKALFIGCALVWAATSSALRAPPLMLLGKYAARPAVPWLASLALLGFGVVGAAAPYLTITLRTIDPRLPFAVASAALFLATFALSPIERRMATSAGLASAAPTMLAAAERQFGPLPARAAAFAIAVVVLGIGFQIHFSIDSARLFLRYAKPPDLETLMPVFWIGFNIAMFAAAPLVARFGGLAVMGAAGIAGGAFALAATAANGLPVLVVAQFGAGAAWGIAMMSGVAAALAIGAPGNGGRVVGMMYSALALATFARMSAVAGGLAGAPAYEALFAWAPTIFWLSAGPALLALGRRSADQASEPVY
ncbi:MAG TPA: hypothetical protein VLV50_10100 [Stellaceae bacterium]|nr:hypothetical protein [Stellaceae bacterium]